MQQKRPQRRKGWYCFVVEHLNWNQTGRDVVVVIIYRFSVSQDRIRRCDFISRFKMWVNFMKWVEIKDLSSQLELQAFLGTISPLWTTILVDICTTLPDMAGLCFKPMVHWHHPSKRRQIFYVDVPIVWLNLHVIIIFKFFIFPSAQLSFIICSVVSWNTVQPLASVCFFSTLSSYRMLLPESPRMPDFPKSLCFFLQICLPLTGAKLWQKSQTFKVLFICICFFFVCFVSCQ